jgi:hypothetical protein
MAFSVVEDEAIIALDSQPILEAAGADLAAAIGDVQLSDSRLPAFSPTGHSQGGASVALGRWEREYLRKAGGTEA